MDDGSVPWHRVLRADGSLAEHLYTEQRQRLLAEGVRFRGDRVDLPRFRWDGEALELAGVAVTVGKISCASAGRAAIVSASARASARCR